MSDSIPLDGLLLTRDLMFTSKVTGTASALGLRVETLGSVEHLRARVAESNPRAVFVDLGCADFDPVAIMECLTLPRPTVIAFGSHVDVERLESARAAGFDNVLPRSKFSASLPELLRQTFGLMQ